MHLSRIGKRSIYKMVSRLPKPLFSSLTHVQKYTYMSPIDKPIYSLSLTSMHQFSSQLMQYCSVEYLVCSELSVIAGAMIFRFGSEVIANTIRQFKYQSLRTKKDKQKEQDKKVEEEKETNSVVEVQQTDRALIRWIHKIFVVDMVRDLQFYGVIRQDIIKTAWTYYRPSVVISNLVSSYLALNFFRGGNLILTSPQLSHFCSQTEYFPNLYIHDPNFVSPLLIILLNFFLLKKSRHPFLIHINHPSNIFTCFNLAFMSGLIFVPLPAIYHLSYIGYAAAHLIIRGCRYSFQDIVRYFRKIVKTK